MTMTTSQQTISDAARSGQGAFVHAVQIWADNVQKFIGWVPTRDGKVPSANEVVDSYFRVLEQILYFQREVAKSFLATSTKAAWAMQDVANEAAPKKS
jgi:hypothetical protein